MCSKSNTQDSPTAASSSTHDQNIMFIWTYRLSSETKDLSVITPNVKNLRFLKVFRILVNTLNLSQLQSLHLTLHPSTYLSFQPVVAQLLYNQSESVRQYVTESGTDRFNVFLS